MTNAEQTEGRGWTTKQAILFAAFCLAAGIAGGWFIFGFHSPAPGAPAAADAVPAPAAAAMTATAQQPGPAQLQSMADTQAAPFLEKLKADPANPDLLARVGDIYYDAQVYPTAVGYYARALKAKPSDAAVRTDMATAYWYIGDADTAIAEFDKALTYAPTNPNTLFNLGLVKWRSKHDADGALADWQKLLAANPNYEQKDKVEQLMTEVKQHVSLQPVRSN